MSKRKVIITVKHGRPSTATSFASMNNKDAVLIQRRQLKKGGVNGKVIKEYYRVFDRSNILSSDEIETNKENGVKKYPFGVYKKATKVDLQNSIVIRWGTREEFVTDKGTIIYNTSSAIKNATDKKHSRELFIKNGVNCPMLVTSTNINKVGNFPIIARPLVHSKGRNFITLNTKEAFLNHYNKNKNSWYYSDFVDKSREFRVHVAHGKALALMEKVAPKDKSIAWNRAQNDTDPFTYVKWSDVDTQNLGFVIQEALKATVAVGLDFGGVDVMVHKGKAYVLEVNTSPTLNTSPYVAERWGKYFDWLFRKNTRRNHWETSDMKKGSSLIWKNYQLADEELKKR